MAAAPKKPEAGSTNSSGSNRRPRTQRTSSSLSAASSASAVSTAAVGVETPPATLNLTAEAVAALPPPGLSGPTSLVFSPKSPTSSSGTAGQYLAFVSSLPPPTAVTNTTLSRSSSGSAATAAAAAAAASGERQLCILNVQDDHPVIQPLIHYKLKRPHETSAGASGSGGSGDESFPNCSTGNSGGGGDDDSLEERLRRERQRLQTNGGVTQFAWSYVTRQRPSSSSSSETWQHASNTFNGNDDINNNNYDNEPLLRILVPIKGNVYIQDGIHGELYCVYDKHSLLNKRAKQWNGSGNGMTSTSASSLPSTTLSASIVGRDTGAIDPQLSPDGTMVAFVVAGDIHVVAIDMQQQQLLQQQSKGQRRSAASSSRGHRSYSSSSSSRPLLPPIQVTYGARQDETVAITHGLADFVAQEEMDRYRGFWWQKDSSGILFAKVDETNVPPYRITHQGKDGSTEESYEDHRYPFAGQENPRVQLGYVKITEQQQQTNATASQQEALSLSQKEAWSRVVWFAPPREAWEYLARVTWLSDGSACAQWQNRTQTTLVLTRMDPTTGKSRTLLTERSDVWINLHHMFHVLPRPVHPEECADCEWKHGHQNLPSTLPEGSFSFLFASERSLYSHLYLYTYVPGIHGALLLRTLTYGEWVVESIVGVDMDNDAVYVTGTFDSPLERHLYAVPITNRKRLRDLNDDVGDGDMADDTDMDHDMDRSNHSSSNTTNGIGVRRGLKSVMSALSGAAKPPRHRSSGSSSMSISSEACDDDDTSSLPVRLTVESGMHNVVMDEDCRFFVDNSSDLGRPTSVKVYSIANGGLFSSQTVGDNFTNNAVQLLFSLYDATQDNKAMTSLLGAFDMISSGSDQMLNLPPPEIISFPTSDGTETLHAALYKPDARIYGQGPYPLVCAVYGGPHVQRVNRSWSQCADMRAQRLRSLGFAVVKCDNRGSSRRGLKFESAIQRRLGRLEVLDQVTTVRQLTMRGIADPSRVGIYGWSYGGYLSAMCLCRAPDIFHVAIAGAPVTSWDGYDTHYTERYMGLPGDNPTGYRESAIFDHVPNMRGKLMIVHGLIDENVHFRHTARLISRLIASGKDYDLLIFPDERHSPRRLRDRIYMEQRISDYFLRHLLGPSSLSSSSLQSSSSNMLHTTTVAEPLVSSTSTSSSLQAISRHNSNASNRTDSPSVIRSMAGRL